MKIRPYQPDDLEALYAISLATGNAGADASHLYSDRRMMGHIYSAPYASLEPGLTRVVEDRAGVAGFVVGAVDTEAWEAKLEREWWPALRRRYAAPPAADAARRTPDQRRAFMIHHPARTPSAVTREYPAHAHMNLLPRLQGRGMGSRLFNDWIGIAVESGAQAVHVAVNRDNVGAVRFWRKLGFVDLNLDELPPGRTIWLGRPHAENR
ncbi:GNAT family N-acetyltransferase [Desertibaculum subflavum]|uniref:GNAT family N-acetyltransferase n=1 Tax=Desertibaculum subflavum TaxID=2268458 RepID=UPI0034D3624C